jgi:PAS domain-containing protein
MSQLRQQAEEILRNQSEDLNNLSLRDAQNLLHELQVHQIELEMQNDELRKANEQFSILHKKYAELYDFAPSGYCTLDQNGQILEANLTLAEQLGVERSYLINTLFYHYLVKKDRD